MDAELACSSPSRLDGSDDLSNMSAQAAAGQFDVLGELRHQLDDCRLLFKSSTMLSSSAFDATVSIIKHNGEDLGVYFQRDSGFAILTGNDEDELKFYSSLHSLLINADPAINELFLSQLCSHLQEVSTQQQTMVQLHISPQRPSHLSTSLNKATPLEIDVHTSEAGSMRADSDRSSIEIADNGTVRIGRAVVWASGASKDDCTVSLQPEELDWDHAVEVGRGSSGCVRRMLHRPTGRYVAVKEIKGSTPQRMHEIHQEIDALFSAERCPQLTEFIGAFCSEGSVYIVTEFMDGSLEGLPKVPELVLGSIAKMLLMGLRHLHNVLRFVHRDLKPSNLLFSYSTGAIKISDFGVSSRLSASTSLAESFVGTVTFMAPERLEGKPYSFSSDIWSLGLILLQLRLGEHPLHAKIENEKANSEGKFWKLLSFYTHDSLEDLLPTYNISESLQSFLRRCLNKDPSQRATVEELMAHPFVTHSAADAQAEEAPVSVSTDFLPREQQVLKEWLDGATWRFSPAAELPLDAPQNSNCAVITL